MHTNLFLLPLQILNSLDVCDLFRTHALPPVCDDAMRPKGTLCHGRILCQDVSIDVIGYLCCIVIQLLLFLQFVPGCLLSGLAE